MHDPRTIGDLGNPRRRQPRLVEEDAAEMVAIGKDLRLMGKVGAARIDQVEAGQPVVGRDLLGTQVLLDRHRIVGAALDRRVVADDHAVAPGDLADPGDDAGTVDGVVIHAVRGERRELEERRIRIEKAHDALARQELAAARCRSRAAAEPPAAASARRACSSSTSARIAAAFAGKPGEFGSMLDVRMATREPFCFAPA